MRTSRLLRLLLLGVVGLSAVVLLFPIYWMVMTSVVPTRQLLTGSPALVPVGEGIGLQAYRDVLAARPVLDWLSNSVFVTVWAALIASVVSTLAGYSLSRFRTRGQQAMGFTLLFSRMLPGTLLIVPVYALVSSLGRIDDLWSLVFVNVVAIVPFTTWMMKGFVDGIPRELEESARVDGCSSLGALWRIVLPLMRPGLAATVTYSAVLAWSDFLFARTLMTTPDGWTVTVGIASFIGQYDVDWAGLMATGLLSMLPLVVVFALLEPFLVRGMTAGSVKG